MLDLTQDKCYRCSSPAVTKEHVPPRNLFPEDDSKRRSYRKNLIKVPSCNFHNGMKSDDDEFLMISIAGIVGNNFVGFMHNATKVDRAIKRKSRQFLYKAIIRNAKNKTVKIEGYEFPVCWGTPDYFRLIDCFRNIAYGLRFHEFKTVFFGDVKVLLAFVNYTSKNTNTFVKFMHKRFEMEELAEEIKGDNPEVFQYQFCKPDEFGLRSLKLTFYAGTIVYVAFQPIGTELPNNAGIEFINNGIHTVFELGDEQYEFNKK